MIRLPDDTTLRVAIFTALACGVAGAVYTLAGIDPAPVMIVVLNFAPPILVLLWVQKDARRRGIVTVLDFGLFLWFAWPVVLPWYAFKSRGRQGWRLLLGLMVLMFATGIGSLIAMAWSGFGAGD